jgi:anti-sigma B factor antagonist
MESEAAALTVEVTTHTEADAVVVIRGDLDLGAAATLVGAIDEIVATSPSSVTLDLAGVTFLDSSGLGALLTLHARCQTDGITFKAINPPSQVCRVLELTNLTELFNFH